MGRLINWLLLETGILVCCKCSSSLHLCLVSLCLHGIVSSLNLDYQETSKQGFVSNAAKRKERRMTRGEGSDEGQDEEGQGCGDNRGQEHSGQQSEGDGAWQICADTLNLVPCTLHLITMQIEPCPMNLTPCMMHHAPWTLHRVPCTQNFAYYTLHLLPCTSVPPSPARAV